MEPVAFLKLAERLCNQPDDEASLRSAVSRGYYALFHLAKNFVEKHVEKLPKDAKSHDKVYTYLNNCGVMEIVEVAGNLNDLRDERNDADYDLTTPRFSDPNVANLLFVKTRSSYRDFERFVQSADNRKKLIKGISQYKKKIDS